MKKSLKKKSLIAVTAILLSFIFLSGFSNSYQTKDYNYDVEIHRDTWGVPHIYGQSDKDAAFGLAYAHCEDDYETIEEVILALRGEFASVKGYKYAPIDYLVGLLKVWDNVNSKYDEEISDEVKLICDAYADGVNRYIEKNNIKSNIYPARGKDVVAGFYFRTPLMFEFDWHLKELMKDDKPSFDKYASRTSTFSMYGSNTIAVSPERSADNYTRITTNSHQPWEGPVTWYEAHINSKEGWNMSGGLFPGSPLIFKGYNDSLSWSHTVNNPDLVDIFELSINPDNENQYMLDGNWIDLEVKKHPIKIKLLGPFKWTFYRDLYWSVHGPVVKTSHGVYALRYSAFDRIGQIEQWFRMNKSSNVKEFKKAMQMMEIPMFNTLYADYMGNIYYIYNALIPKRKNGYEWSKIVPGDDSSLIWDNYYDFSEIPQSLNPKSGYLQNCNSTPYMATVGQGNPKKVLPDETGIEIFQTNRAFRANELYGQDTSITREEFYQYKYDAYYSKESVMNYALKRFLSEVDRNQDEYIEGIKILENWNLNNDMKNKGAALALLTFELTYDIADFKYDYDKIYKKFKESVDFLKSNYGKLDIELGELQIIKRGNKVLPLSGAPDVLRAIYTKSVDDKEVAIAGDCFFQIIEWDEYGVVNAKSIHQYGSATKDSNSPHYSDQSDLFSKHKMKDSFIRFNDLKENIKKSYTP